MDDVDRAVERFKDAETRRLQAAREARSFFLSGARSRLRSLRDSLEFINPDVGLTHSQHADWQAIRKLAAEINRILRNG